MGKLPVFLISSLAVFIIAVEGQNNEREDLGSLLQLGLPGQGTTNDDVQNEEIAEPPNVAHDRVAPEIVAHERVAPEIVAHERVAHERIAHERFAHEPAPAPKTRAQEEEEYRDLMELRRAEKIANRKRVAEENEHFRKIRLENERNQRKEERHQFNKQTIERIEFERLRKEENIRNDIRIDPASKEVLIQQNNVMARQKQEKQQKSYEDTERVFEETDRNIDEKRQKKAEERDRKEQEFEEQRFQKRELKKQKRSGAGSSGSNRNLNHPVPIAPKIAPFYSGPFFSVPVIPALPPNFDSRFFGPLAPQPSGSNLNPSYPVPTNFPIPSYFPSGDPNFRPFASPPLPPQPNRESGGFSSAPNTTSEM